MVSGHMLLSFIWAASQLTGLLGSFIDDMFACDETLFRQLTEEKRKGFQVKLREYDYMRH